MADDALNDLENGKTKPLDLDVKQWLHYTF